MSSLQTFAVGENLTAENRTCVMQFDSKYDRLITGKAFLKHSLYSLFTFIFPFFVFNVFKLFNIAISLQGTNIIELWPVNRDQDSQIVPHTHEQSISCMLYNAVLNQVVSACIECILKVRDYFPISKYKLISAQ